MIYLKTGFYFASVIGQFEKKKKQKTKKKKEKKNKTRSQVCQEKMVPWSETLIWTVILNKIMRNSWQCSLTVVRNDKSVKTTLWFIVGEYVRPRRWHTDHEFSPELGIGNKWSYYRGIMCVDDTPPDIVLRRTKKKKGCTVFSSVKKSIYEQNALWWTASFKKKTIKRRNE